MSHCDDPFIILGVRREATLEEVKRAYRRLAMHWHPDRNSSDRAEAEFKRVHAAYQLLLDPQWMATWQQSRTACTTSASEDVAKENVGEDVTREIVLTLEEAARGCRKSVELLESVRCGACGGSGYRQHSHSVPCPGCSGCGRVARTNGRTAICTGCGGRGYVRQTECPECAGSGWRDQTRTLAVTVPPGLLEGERLRLAGQAPLSPGGVSRAAGDLYLQVRLSAHAFFVVHGNDLHCDLPLSVFRLLAGGRVEVPTLHGMSAVEIRPCAPQTVEYRLAGRGFPGRNGGPAGDLVVHLQVVYPENLHDDDSALLDQMERRLFADLDQRAPALAAWVRRVQRQHVTDDG